MDSAATSLLTLAALVVTAFATAVYAVLQGKLVKIMGKDLRFRITPVLYYRPGKVLILNDAENKVEATVENVGTGFAVDVRADVLLNGEGEPTHLSKVPSILAPKIAVDSSFRIPKDRPNYVVEMTCTDSAALNDYYFKWTDDGKLAVRRTTPHREDAS